MSKLKATVLFDYDAEASDELTLRTGDTLTGIKKIEEGWCQGILNGKTGMFPDNFVKIEEDKPAPPKPAPAKAKKEAQRLMKVTFEYAPQNEDELKLEIGDIVEVLQDEEVGWSRGRSHDKEGVFPTNFCVAYTKSPSPAPVAADNVESEEPHNQAAPKKVKGIGFGNIFGEGPIKLKQSAQRDDTDRPGGKKAPETKAQTAVKPTARRGTKVPVKDKTEKFTSSVKKTKPPVEKCRATFEYTAVTKDELTLAKGDIITITNKNCADPGWWEGEITDSDGRKRHGMFPDNFVELLPTSDEVIEETVEVKASDSKPKSKHPEPDLPSAKGKPSPSAVKISNSLKRVAPQVPPPAAKPHPEATNDAEAADLAAVTNSVPEEQQLTHYKRVGGPKNRRKPDSAGRRERAKEVAEEEVTPEVADDSTEPEPQPEEEPPPLTPKRDTVRGIQVMPSPSGAPDSGDKPSWMKDLKNRSSQKKASGAFAVSPTKPEETTNEKPDWLSNLRKKPKAGEKGVVSPGAPKPAPGLTSPKPFNHSQSTKLPSTPSSTNHTPPVQPPSPDKHAADEKTDKTRSFKKNMKSKSENDVLANAPIESPPEVKHPPEVKKPPMKPQVALQPPTKPMIDLPKKPAAAVKPKPPPPKSKPTLPGGKPFPSSSSVDELKDDVKNLKEQFANFQLESKKEISRLTKELDDEKRHRISLQAEVAQLRKQIG